MLIPGQPPIIHRRWDGTSRIPTAGGYATTAGWSPTGTLAATVSGCVIPGPAHAAAVGVMGYSDPANPASYAGLFSGCIHLTPGGQAIEIGLRLRFPRYLYVECSGNLSLASELQAAYAPLGAMGVRAILGTNLQRPYAAVVPVATSAESPNYFRDPVYAAEPDDYKGGDLFMASVEGGWYGVADANFTAPYSGTISGGYFYVGSDPNYPVNTFGTYTVLETAKVTVPSAPGFLVSRNSVVVSVDMANRDIATAQIEWNKYRRFKQKLYVHNDPIPKVVTSGNFSTTRAELAAMIAPSPVELAIYANGDNAGLAAQIISDAITFFS